MVVSKLFLVLIIQFPFSVGYYNVDFQSEIKKYPHQNVWLGISRAWRS